MSKSLLTRCAWSPYRFPECSLQRGGRVIQADGSCGIIIIISDGYLRCLFFDSTPTCTCSKQGLLGLQACSSVHCSTAFESRISAKPRLTCCFQRAQAAFRAAVPLKASSEGSDWGWPAASKGHTVCCTLVLSQNIREAPAVLYWGQRSNLLSNMRGDLKDPFWRRPDLCLRVLVERTGTDLCLLIDPLLKCHTCVWGIQSKHTALLLTDEMSLLLIQRSQLAWTWVAELAPQPVNMLS